MSRLLSVLARDDKPTITRLAHRMGLDRSTLGRNVRVLERQGLVRMRPGQDERTRLLELTEAGDQALTAARPLWQQAQEQMRTLLGPHDTEDLLAQLGQLRGA